MEVQHWGKGVSFHLRKICSLDVIVSMAWASLLQSLVTYEMVT